MVKEKENEEEKQEELEEEPKKGKISGDPVVEISGF